MRRSLETISFVAIALAIHIGFFLQIEEGAVGAAGNDGDAAMTVQAISAEVMDMLDALDTPPEMPELEMVALEVEQPDVTPPQLEIAPVAPPITPRAQTQAMDVPELRGGDIALPEMMLAPPVPETALPELAMITPPTVETPQPDAPRPITPSPRTDRPQPPELTPPTAVVPPSLVVPPPPPPPPPPEAEPEPEQQAQTPPPPPRKPTPPPPRETVQTEQPREQPAPQPTQPRNEQAQQSNRNVEGQAATTAAGAGGGTVAGNRGSSADPSLSPARVNSLKSSWGNRIRSRIERRKPRIPGRPEGVAMVRVVVSGDGRLVGVSLVRSSGQPDLDKAAVDSVHRAGRFPKAPKALGSGPHSFAIPVEYRR
ncbi:MAG: TonB family protein [Pseudomonadota bacterium]